MDSHHLEVPWFAVAGDEWDMVIHHIWWESLKNGRVDVDGFQYLMIFMDIHGYIFMDSRYLMIFMDFHHFPSTNMAIYINIPNLWPSHKEENRLNVPFFWLNSKLWTALGSHAQEQHESPVLDGINMTQRVGRTVAGMIYCWVSVDVSEGRDLAGHKICIINIHI